jgi:hypothetical protein
MNINVIVDEIFKNAVVETSVPMLEINKAKELANFCRDKLQALLSDTDLALQDLKGEKEPSVLSSQEDFKSLLLKLENLKRKISVI